MRGTGEIIGLQVGERSNIIMEMYMREIGEGIRLKERGDWFIAPLEKEVFIGVNGGMTHKRDSGEKLGQMAQASKEATKRE